MKLRLKPRLGQYVIGSARPVPRLRQYVPLVSLEVVEQLFVGALSVPLPSIIGHYLPFWGWGTPLVVVIAAIIAWRLGSRYPIARGTFLALGLAYYLLGQPTLMFLFSALSGVGTAAYGIRHLHRHRFASFFGGVFLVPIVMVGIYYVLCAFVLPVVNPYTVWLNDHGPALFNVPALLIVGYCAWRQPRDQRSLHWLASPMLSLFFLVCFWPVHSYVGMVAVSLTAITLTETTWAYRPTEDGIADSSWLLGLTIGVSKVLLWPLGKILSFLRLGWLWSFFGKVVQGLTPPPVARPFAAHVVAAMAFVGIFWVSNSWEEMYDYQMANAVSVREIDWRDFRDSTPPIRLVPYLAALDYIRGDNQATITRLSNVAYPIVRHDGKNGEPRFYWGAVRYLDTQKLQDHPGLLLSHPLALTGGCEGAVLADAGERGRYGEPIRTNFPFCGRSKFTLGVFYLSHPGATATEEGFIALTEDNDPYVLIPYVNKVLQAGAMVPSPTGVMILSPSGIVRDLLPWQAAAMFPGVHFVLSNLANQYVERWAHDSSLFAKHLTGNQFEVSKYSGEGNSYPYWEFLTERGLVGVFNLEPAGAEQNGWMRIGLFDRSSLSMEIVNVQNLKLPGPKLLMANAANAAHIGLPAVTANESLTLMSTNHCLYIMTALLSQSSEAYHGYSRNSIADVHAQSYVDVTSGPDVVSAMADLDRTSCPVEDTN